MNHPSGADILALLIKLLEEQEKVKIKYTIEKGEQHGKSDNSRRSGSEA